ncbi:reverse transcriptase domain-containing protein [Tanacetum coccineum]|uniref:Reverse transcriptase domain-containing protein n=1 Tax=Tanacetum coccineum TaxID=301880 RepID=A0ABQ5J243_9ASTR
MADNRTMAQLLQAPTEGYEDAIVIPEINANFELKHGLINLVQNKQFFGHDKEDPHAHIRYFNKITSTMRFPDIPSTSIKLMLFPFSLEGSARIWLEKEPPRSILTWDDLVSKFINQFFPPSKTTNLRALSLRGVVLEVAKPLASLTQKIQKYEWVKEQEEAFQTLKDNLCCVLMQRGKVENATSEMLRGLDQLMERKEGGGMYLLWVSLIGDVRTLMIDEAHASRSWWKIYFAALVDIAEGIENTDTHLPLTEFSIIIVIIRVFDVLYLKRCMEGSVGHMFFGLKLEKFGRLDQNWYKRQQIRVEVGDKVMLEVSSWKDVVHFGKKKMLAPRYVGPFEIIKGIEEIKIAKTLCFAEEPIEIIDREVKSLKRSRILIVKSIGTRSKLGKSVSKMVKVGHGVGVTHDVARRDLEAAFEYPGEFHSPILLCFLGMEMMQSKLGTIQSSGYETYAMTSRDMYGGQCTGEGDSLLSPS